MAAMDWNVDLTSSLEDKSVMQLCASSPPDSSSASELGELTEYEFNYSEIYQQTESFAPPGGEELGLLDSLLAFDDAPSESHGPSTPPEAWASASDFHATPPPVAASEKASVADSAQHAHTKPLVSTTAACAQPGGPDAAAGDAGRKRKEMEAPPALAPAAYPQLQTPAGVAVVTGVPRVTPVGSTVHPRCDPSHDCRVRARSLEPRVRSSFHPQSTGHNLNPLVTIWC